MQMGVAALARHPTALPRLARRIADELEEVYEWRFGAERRYVFCFSLTFSFLCLPRSGQADGGFLFLPLLLAPISRVGVRCMGTSRRNSRRNQLQERKERRLRSLRTAINLPKNKKECEKKALEQEKQKKTKNEVKKRLEKERDKKLRTLGGWSLNSPPPPEPAFKQRPILKFSREATTRNRHHASGRVRTEAVLGNREPQAPSRHDAPGLQRGHHPGGGDRGRCRRPRAWAFRGYGYAA